MFREKLKIIDKKQLTEDVVVLRFEKPNEFKFKPGQFVNIRIEREGTTRIRAYSILNTNRDKTIDIVLKIVPEGFGSRILGEASIGEEFEVIGPFGFFVFEEKAKKHHFISAGTGIGPFYSIINEYLQQYPEKQFNLLAGYRYKKNILLNEELKELDEEYTNFSYDVTLTKEEWNGLKGRVQKHIEIDKEAIYYICGLKELVVETKELLLKKEVPEENIRVERYS